MKNIFFILCICLNSTLFAQNTITISNNALYYKNEVFKDSREKLLELELKSNSPIPQQPKNSRVAILALMTNNQRVGTGVFIQEKSGQWLQVTILKSKNDITVDLMESGTEEIVGIKPTDCKNCWTYQYGYQKTVAPNGKIVWKEIYF